MGAERYRTTHVLSFVVAIASLISAALSLTGCGGGGGAGMGNIMQGAGGLFAGSPKIAMGNVVGPPKSVTTKLTQALQTLSLIHI